MKRAPRSRQRHDLYAKYHDYDSEISDLLGECGIMRLKQVFQQHGAEEKAVTCPAIDGILSEASDIASDVDDKQVLDAALIAAAQAVEHYEITRYGTLVAWAKLLDREDCASLLKQNLDEEAATDAKLSKLATSMINRRAA